PRPQLVCWAHKRFIRASWSADVGRRQIPSWTRRGDAAAGRGSRNGDRSLPVVRWLGLLVLRELLHRCRFSLSQSTTASDGRPERTRIQRHFVGGCFGQWLRSFQICPSTQSPRQSGSTEKPGEREDRGSLRSPECYHEQHLS